MSTSNYHFSAGPQALSSSGRMQTASAEASAASSYESRLSALGRFAGGIYIPCPADMGGAASSAIVPMRVGVASRAAGSALASRSAWPHTCTTTAAVAARAGSGALDLLRQIACVKRATKQLRDSSDALAASYHACCDPEVPGREADARGAAWHRAA